MKEVEFWNWWLPSDRGGKPTKSRWRMSAETAAVYPGAVRVDGTREVRMLPESVDEHQHTNAWLDKPLANYAHCAAECVAGGGPLERKIGPRSNQPKPM